MHGLKTVVVYGLVKLLHFSLPTLAGYIFLLTLFLSTMYSRVFKTNSPTKLTPMHLTYMVRKLIGFTIILKGTVGSYHKEFQDGWNGKTEQMLCLQTRVKLDGIISWREPATQSTSLSMSTITIFTLMSTKSHVKREELQVQDMELSYQPDNSVQLLNGEAV